MVELVRQGLGHRAHRASPRGLHQLGLERAHLLLRRLFLGYVLLGAEDADGTAVFLLDVDGEAQPARVALRGADMDVEREARPVANGGGAPPPPPPPLFLFVKVAHPRPPPPPTA